MTRSTTILNSFRHPCVGGTSPVTGPNRSINGFNPPDVVGLCEVENDSCLYALTHFQLRQVGYRYIHFESPDRRGIDCALLYRPERFTPIHSEAVPVELQEDTSFHTRDILYTCGVTNVGDTLHLLVCHLPSRRGGQKPSEIKRLKAVECISLLADSIRKHSGTADIIVMGDMNDTPEDFPMEQLVRNDSLINLMTPLCGKDFGTHKYKGTWSIFDQFIISRSLFNSTTGLHPAANQQLIYRPDFLLEPDNTYLGQKPFRTYSGFRYHGGYSDHLPILLRLTWTH